MNRKTVICQEIEVGGDLYEKAVGLRYALFFKEHGLPESIVFDENETASTHIAISNKTELIAYGRLSKTSNNEYIISQMVVSPSYQHQGYGSKVLAKIIQIAISNQAKEIILEARIPAIGLYEKQGFIKQGFIKQGQVYKSESTGVPHIKMIYRTGLSL